MKDETLSRRHVLKRAAALGIVIAMEQLLPTWAVGVLPNADSKAQVGEEVVHLIIDDSPFTLDGRTGRAMTINGSIPGPVVRLTEGRTAVLRVTNNLDEITSIHWHGLLVPPDMDGVPGVSFAGIKPGTTFTYRFPIHQSGTYWFHSHSGGQEMRGMYAPMIIDPVEPEPFQYDRDYVVMLSDWTFESPDSLLANLKKQSGYYNFQKRTAGEFVSDIARAGFAPTLSDYLEWARMRMDPTDFADVTGYTFSYLMNGLSPIGNWTGIFHPGEKVRLRFIDAATMTFYDVRIPGLKMTIVQVDGQNVQPIVVDEFRFGPAETYDVILEPTDDRVYTIFAETMDRSGYARGTLATQAGLEGGIPERRPRPIRTMEDMGMSMEGMEMPGMNTESQHASGTGIEQDKPMRHVPNGEHIESHPAMKEMNGMHLKSHDQNHSPIPGSEPVRHGPDDHGTGNQTVAEYSQNRMGEPGRGLEGSERRVLVYTDLKSLEPYPDQREPEREIELHITGHMERYIWSFDGKKYSEAKEPIHFNYGERIRFTFVNDTMMEHPLHLHGMWMHLENGAGPYLPRKHTVIVKPAERVSVAISADAPGRWAFHCHLLLHMESGMFRVVEVSNPKS